MICGMSRSVWAWCAQAGWGDDEADDGPLNRRYDPTLYSDYSASTRANLKRVAEAAVDLELCEAVVLHIDATAGPGAILLFLPGTPCLQPAGLRI